MTEKKDQNTGPSFLCLKSSLAAHTMKKVKGVESTMHALDSLLEGERMLLSEAEDVLKPLGFSIGGSWDYDHGYFDYKLSDHPGYQFIRLPFTAAAGELDSENCIVRFGQPFLLGHRYQENLDDHAEPSLLSASFNQFSEPADKDAEIKDEYIAAGKVLLQDAEAALLNRPKS